MPFYWLGQTVPKVKLLLEFYQLNIFCTSLVNKYYTNNNDSLFVCQNTYLFFNLLDFFSM